jgi:hypothetical protein
MAFRTYSMAALLLAGGGLLPTAAVADEGAEGVTAVASRVSSDYVRERLADGSFKPEGYAFGKGGYYVGPIRDDTIDRLDFLDIARVIAVPLAAQKFVPSRDPAKTRLLIMVYWGTTTVPEPIATTNAYFNYQITLQQAATVDPNSQEAMMSSAMLQIQQENTRRDRIDYKNAELLGFDSDDDVGGGLVGTDYGNAIQYTALRESRNDRVSEIEGSRYFVVLMAYDFQMMWKQRKHKLLWETRFSIDQPRNDFTKALPSMARSASRYFGQDSHGLVRELIPRGHVEIGAPTLVELLFPSAKNGAP